MKIKKISMFLLLIIIAAVLIIMMGMAVVNLKEEKQFKIINKTIEKETNEDIVSNLKKDNEDCIGYVEIPNTSISYPVMQTKDDPDYYLDHNFNKKYSFYGTPYLSAYCDLKDSDNLIIYGHNINGGKIFGALEKFKDEEYLKKHNKIIFTTNKITKYKIFAVMSVNIYDFKYWAFTMAKDKADFNMFIEKIKRKALIKSKVNPKYGEKLLMLSTCDNGRGEDWRIVVVGVEM